MTDKSHVILEDRGVLTVGGTDRHDFLQGLISNDIAKVSSGQAIWAALLTPQGKYLHDFFVVEIDGVLHIDCEADRLTDLGQRLSRYKLRADVDLGIGEGLLVAALIGDGASAAVGLPDDAGALVALDGGVAFVDPRLAAAGARAILPSGEAESILESLGFTKAAGADYDRARLRLGLPDGSRDLVVEKSVLLESNFDCLNGVDWDKGCYVGQEVTARTHYRGLVKKRLLPVTIEGPSPAPGAPVTCDNKDAGEMRSATDGLGIALLRLDAVERVAAGEAELTAGTTRLVPNRPDWATF
ncbi:MAG: folate-binding protein [Alphaproteobacteria bacterium]|nr:folate-binding protein [Alphaproteobacteria bacterium]